MSSIKTAPRSRFQLPDWLPHRVAMPCILSIMAHACLLVLFATTLRSCHQAPVGFLDEPTREIGIFVEREGDRVDAVVAGDPNDADPSDAPIVPMATEQFAPTQATSVTPPAEVSLPKIDASPQIGVGVNLPNGAAVADPGVPVKSTGNVRPPAGTPGGRPGAAFMGTRDEAMKVIFVIDASGSMTSHNAMQVAKSALMSSLQAMDERQQFMIIFYDDKPHVIKLHDEAKPAMAVASDLNKTLARQKISGIQPGSGTDHLPPLEMALQMNPDVIFFLTDALEPPLWPKDLDRLKTMSRGKIRIHAIEFGQGPELPQENDTGNFLRKLARQNGGTYRYHDVTRNKAAP